MRWSAIFVGISMLLLSSIAAADSTFVSVGLLPVSGPILVPTFNTSLGTLNSVEVTITGDLTVDFATQVNLVPPGVPLATPFSVAVDQNFGGGPDAPFNWLDVGTFQFTGVGSGLGEIQVLNQFFNYTFQFDNHTDLTGFTSVSAAGPLIPPGLAFGTTSGFTSPILPFTNELVTLLPSGLLPTYGGTFINATEQGDILIEYDYTPPAPPNNMSEPGTLALLASGLFGLMARRQAKRAV